MLVSLYTSRVVLNTLGVEDFGIFNVVGGIVVMFSFLNSSMATATQRFLSYEMGCGSNSTLNSVFSMAINIHAVIAIVVVILAETMGLWFFYNKIQIPTMRFDAAFWVYQISIFNFLVSILTVPYNALIIASEKMSIYAYISVLEAALKLFVVFLLLFSSWDKLIMYSILLFLVNFIIRLIYIVYCKRNFIFCRYSFFVDFALFKSMITHSSWMMFGTFSQMMSTQGINILINMFFGVAFNAARGIAVQVQSAVQVFVGNFMMAVNPQIVKQYSSGNIKKSFQLVFQSSKFAFILVYILAFPLLLETEYVLQLWLKEIPALTVVFTKLVLIDLFFTALYPSLSSVTQASGFIRNYQLSIAVSFILVFFLTYLFYSFGARVYVTFLISIVISFIGVWIRLLIVYFQFSFPLLSYIREVLSPIFITIVVSIILPLLIYTILESSFFRFILIFVVNFFSVFICFWFIIGTKSEKNAIKRYFLKIMLKYDKVK